jgi:hypothetical protein
MASLAGCAMHVRLASNDPEQFRLQFRDVK